MPLRTRGENCSSTLKLPCLEIIKVTTCELLSEHFNTSLRSMRMFIDTYCSLLLIDREVILSLERISRNAILADNATSRSSLCLSAEN